MVGLRIDESLDELELGCHDPEYILECLSLAERIHIFFLLDQI